MSCDLLCGPLGLSGSQRRFGWLVVAEAAAVVAAVKERVEHRLKVEHHVGVPFARRDGDFGESVLQLHEPPIGGRADRFAADGDEIIARRKFGVAFKLCLKTMENTNRR